jgi:hypothetical protein
MYVYWLESAGELTVKKQIKLSAIVAVLLGTGGVLFALLNARAVTVPQTFLPAKSKAAGTSALVADNAGVLDKRRQFALGMIESGNDDREIGGLGEVSRYQIMPSVWRQYTSSRSYQNPEASLKVAQQHWFALYAQLKQQIHREPTDFDMYVLWNTHYGYYADRGFKPSHLDAVVRDRAQRFVNLVEHGEF